MIIGTMIVKDEAERYLQASLTRLVEICDKVFVADDRSSDESVEIAKELGCVTWTRPDTVPPFIENESLFRQSAWDQMAKQLRVKEGHWILSVDADEYFTGTKSQLKQLVTDAGSRDCYAFPFREVWSIDPLQVRTDGFWGSNCNRRMRKFTPGGKFREAKMGCGSVPVTRLATEIHKMPILHFGYAADNDRKRKSEFYNSIDHGHNNSHIQSILKKPTLEEIDLRIDFWRGRQ